jgi:hypothetical protein
MNDAKAADLLLPMAQDAGAQLTRLDVRPVVTVQIPQL